LGELFGQPEALSQLHGTLSATLTYRHTGPNRWPVGVGRLIISRVRWGEHTIADELRADLRLTERDLQVRDITGRLGEGLFRGTVVYNLRQRDRSYFNLKLERADAVHLFAPIPQLAELIQGPVEANLRGTLGREWRASGVLLLTRGRVLGLDV